MMVEQLPAVLGVPEQVGRVRHAEADVVFALRRDVLGAGHEADLADLERVDVGRRHPDPRRVGEDLDPRAPHHVPADDHVPSGMHDANEMLVQPQLVHLGEAQRLERPIEACVRFAQAVEIGLQALHEAIVSLKTPSA